MTGQHLYDAEAALVDVATARAHIETALTFLERDSGAQAEIGLELLHWVDRAAAMLRRGYLLTVDYGPNPFVSHDPDPRRTFPLFETDAKKHFCGNAPPHQIHKRCSRILAIGRLCIQG